MSELDSVSSYEKSAMQSENSALSAREGGRRRKKGCWFNCSQMCCNKKVVSQDQLLQMYLAEATESSHTSILDD